ncbi:MAG: hypothetical protein LBK28_04550 [Propionibacteriaceae bacterium]|jgi:hypothetical protein|nr:hypothetical protein [Propionibacteriaceae bacterium]
MTNDQGAVLLSPLLPDDPAKVGDFWLDARLTSTASGVAYVAHDEQETSVLLVMLSEGAAGDAAARDRLAGVVNQLHIDTVVARGGEGQDQGRLGNRYRSEDDDPTEPGSTPQAPWVALVYDGSAQAGAEAVRILDEVELRGLAQVGKPAGPGFRLNWIDKFHPGSTRLWPLPWPGRHDRAGALSILASWLLMLLLAALAVLIAILLFQQSPPEAPPPPVPPTGSPSQSSSASSPQSGSPSDPPPSSVSPSPSDDTDSADPSDSASPSDSPSPSDSGSPIPSESGGAGGSPTPDSRL